MMINGRISKLKPLFDNVLLRILTDGEETSGIFFKAQHTPSTVAMGEILALGPKSKGGMAVGNRICFKRHEASLMDMDGADYVLIKENLLLAQLNDEEKKT